MKGGGYHESRKDQGKEPDRCEEKGPGLLLLQSGPVGGTPERVLQTLHYRSQWQNRHYKGIIMDTSDSSNERTKEGDGS
jgi:hypothetical protein